MIRWYLVPRVGDGLSSATAYGPKHFEAGHGFWNCMVAGLEPWVLVKADVAAERDAALRAEPDVLAWPADLDEPVGAILPSVLSRLEEAAVPCHGVGLAASWRDLLILAARTYAVHQRVHATTNTRLLDGVSLDDRRHAGHIDAAARTFRVERPRAGPGRLRDHLAGLAAALPADTLEGFGL